MFRKHVGYMFALVMLVSVALLTGCSTKSVQETPSQDDIQISVTASPSSVGLNETSVLEATVVDANTDTPLANEVITFSVSPSSAGHVSPSTVATDDVGLAAAVFTAIDSGYVIISATIGSGDGAPQTTIGVNVASSHQAGDGNVNITLDKTLLLADGSDSAMVTVTVRDANGQTVPDSTLLAIVAGEKFIDVDGNGYWSNGIDTLVYDFNNNGQWDAFGIVPSYAITEGGSGQAQFVYYSGNDAATVYLRVTVADGNIGGSAEIPLQLTANATINSIFLSSDSINLVVKTTGGIEIAMLNAVGYDVYGNTVPEGQAISFIITDGPGGGEHLDTSGYGPYTILTNSQGKASVPLHSGTVSGTIRVRAYADSILSNATQVMVSAGPPMYIVVGAENCNVDYWDNVAEENEIVAVVSDVYLNPVTDSTVVYFSTDEGTMKSHEARTGALEGTVATKWISGNNVADANGRVMVYAETAGGNVADTMMFYNTHFPDTLIVFGVPASMPADGVSKAYIWVSGYDLNDNPVISGTSFEGEAEYLTANGGSLEDGCYSARDRVELQSKTLDMDYSLSGVVDDGIGATDYVTYWHPAGAVTTYAVTLTTGIAYSGSSEFAPVGAPSPNSIAYFTITIQDRFGNPLGDHSLDITTPSATDPAVPPTVTTNAYGEAYFAWQVPSGYGEYPLTAVDTDPRGGIVLMTRVVIEE